VIDTSISSFNEQQIVEVYIVSLVKEWLGCCVTHLMIHQLVHEVYWFIL